MLSAVEVTTDGFTYGLITPVLGFLLAVLGSALGLRCTVRALSVERRKRAGWLVLGAVSIGTGIFTMHFIAMMGFTASSVPIDYDLGVTYISLGVAVLVTGVGLFLVGYTRHTARLLPVAGVVTGLGVASMHYMGMASMRMTGEIVYNSVLVGLSLVVAVAAATAALWFAISVRRFSAAVVASLLMGVAVTGMHYTGMAAVSVHAHSTSMMYTRVPLETLLPALAVPMLLLVIVGLFVGLDPMAEEELGRPDEEQRGARQFGVLQR
ncbi:MHYT domain-containing protein [Streptomyces sp. ACA25]|uniref:MHYT domain-containing protein n=1 Tax=Streptomyces sp. ACA25 TaxID=3022596 RepID=UPI002307ADF5|nr:MHYT domain-containing protein [Streptomyces sp. ACA25]MDB1088520.1 MHYT domain-containing protein [Streptomyces sp. ACA25]